jgi:hypothetical protein
VIAPGSTVHRSVSERLAAVALAGLLACAGSRCTGELGPRAFPDEAREPSRERPPRTTEMAPRDTAGLGSPAAETQPEPPPACLDADPTPLRRLTNREYDNTLVDLFGRDLLGTSTPSASYSIPATQRVLGFDNNVLAQGVDQVLAEKYLIVAEHVASRTRGAIQMVAPCAPGQNEETCVRAFLATTGLRVWRRPLVEPETASLLGTFAAGREQGGYSDGIAQLLVRMLISPQFLYRVEASGEPDRFGRRRLTSWELASRLSYALWASMPDAPLFEAARGGELESDAGIEREVRRMLQQPRARAMVEGFLGQWAHIEDLLKLNEFKKKPKDLALKTDYATTLVLVESLRKTAAAMVFEGEGTPAALFTSRVGYANAAIAPYFGLTDLAATELTKVSLDPKQRAGLFTHPAILGTNAKLSTTAPIRRAQFVREQVLCQILPTPPADVDQSLPDLKPNQTLRQQHEAHRSDPRCAGCHALLDPLGFGLEAYDHLGLWSPVRDGRAVDSRGELVDADVAGTFDGPIELAVRFATSAQARDCMVTQWFRYAFGREEEAADGCTLARMRAVLARPGARILDLFLATAIDPSFRSRVPGGLP